MFFVFVSKCLLFRYRKTAVFLTTEKIKYHWGSPWVSLLAKMQRKAGTKNYERFNYRNVTYKTHGNLAWLER